ncbi:MAG: arginase family protein [Acidianus sp.]|nr:arginase family protein [Acidianus sp.]
MLTRRARLLKDPGDVRVSELKPVIPLVGVPWDWSTAGRPGARFAPSAIRSELLSFTPLSEDLGCLRVGFDDLGDVDVAGGDAALTGSRAVEAARKAMEAARERGVPAVFLGGDHSITAWTARPFVEAGAAVVVLDSHYDLRRPSEGVTSGAWLRELVESSGARAFVVGVSDYVNPPYARQRAKELGVEVVSRWQVAEGPDQVAERLREALRGSEVYLSIDFDHLAQYFAPGVNSPSPLGMSPQESLAVIEAVASSAKVVGVDVVEVVPQLDPSGLTVRLAAALLLRAVHMAIARRTAS